MQELISFGLQAVGEAVENCRDYWGACLILPELYDGTWRGKNVGQLTQIFIQREEAGIPQISLPLFGKSGIRGFHGDPMWGLVDQQPLELLTGLVIAQKPERVLIVGGGSGLVPLLIHQLLFSNYDPSGRKQVPHVVSVDLGSETPHFPLTPRQTEYILRDGTHCFISEAIKTGMVSRWTDRALDADDPMWPNPSPIGIEAVTADSFPFLQNELKMRKSYDLILVDGSHDRDAVMADLLLAWQLLSDRGILVIDDHGKGSNSGVTTAVEILSFKHGIHSFHVEERGEESFCPRACFFMKSAPRWSFAPEVLRLLN